VRTAWGTELNCFGYFGFGGGYAAVKENKDRPGYGLYCNVCPLAQACWQEHRERTKEIFPDLMAELERVLAAYPNDKGKTALRVFHERFKVAPPDLVVHGGNIEDGMAVAHGAKPKNRERGTLTWPLRSRAKP
jgi:hypothetical protein